MRRQNWQRSAVQIAEEKELSAAATKSLVASKKIEASFAGHLGKVIEPVIKPLGFDWKIGIALISSFAAREVFVGTMATIFSVGKTGHHIILLTGLPKSGTPSQINTSIPLPWDSPF